MRIAVWSGVHRTRAGKFFGLRDFLNFILAALDIGADDILAGRS